MTLFRIIKSIFLSFWNFHLVEILPFSPVSRRSEASPSSVVPVETRERDGCLKFVLSSIPLCDFILNYFACLFSCSYFFPRQKKIRSSPKRKKSISESVHSPQSWGLFMRKTDAELSVICDNSAFRIVLRTITIFLLTQACSMVRSLKSGFHFIGTVSCDILP